MLQNLFQKRIDIRGADFQTNLTKQSRFQMGCTLTYIVFQSTFTKKYRENGKKKSPIIFENKHDLYHFTKIYCGYFLKG